MVLSDTDRDLFYKLNWHLLFYASEQLEFLPRPGSPADIAGFGEENWRRLRDSLYEHPGLFDSFVSRNPFGFPADELAIVQSWKGFVKGKFFVWRYLRRYTVFLSSDTPCRAIGVVALNKPFSFMLGPRLPVAIDAVLLPFRDTIVYDGLFASYPVSFGPGIRSVLNDDYRKAKAREGIVTSFARLRQKSQPARRGRTRVAPDADKGGLTFRYWRGFAKRLPCREEELKLATNRDCPADRLAALAAAARRERILELPSRMGMEVGFDPIEVDVLEVELGGKRRRIEVFNRGGSLYYLDDPAEIQRFHRFVYAIEQTLPAARTDTTE